MIDWAIVEDHSVRGHLVDSTLMYNPGSQGPRPTPPPLPPPPSSQQMCRPTLPPPDPFWQRPKLQAHLASLLENLAILKSIGNELEAIQSLDGAYSGSGHGSRLSRALADEISSAGERSNDGFTGGLDSASISASKEILLKTVRGNVNCWPESISLTAQAAQQLLGVVKKQLHPLVEVLDGSAGHERTQAVKKLADRRYKLTCNRKWRGQKRRRVAEKLRKEREHFESADLEADEWRAREIAKVIAKRKMEKMKELAEKTAKEEKARRQEEMEMVLVIEKLQELRALRIVRLKKQGRFFPEEDDQFVERVRAAVEEEERQAAAAANTSATAAAILNAEEARKAAAVVDRISDHDGLQERRLEVPSAESEVVEPDGQAQFQNKADDDPKNFSGEIVGGEVKVLTKDTESRLPKGSEGLPAEFYHYFFSSSYDMGSLIEVRRAWDTFIMPGGSRIPQHWVEPPPPADPVWASYLTTKQSGKKRRKRTVQ